MKTKKNYFLLSVVLVLIFLLSITCTKGIGGDGEDFVEINDFYIEPLADTVPCEINVIFNYTASGKTDFCFIHHNAVDCWSPDHKDTSFRGVIVFDAKKITNTDTLQLCYEDAKTSYKI